jgi:hypothetical protein
MDFRWVMGITLWTLLSGPIFSGPRTLPPGKDRTAAMSPAQRTACPPAPSWQFAPREGKKK